MIKKKAASRIRLQLLPCNSNALTLLKRRYEGTMCFLMVGKGGFYAGKSHKNSFSIL